MRVTWSGPTLQSGGEVGAASHSGSRSIAVVRPQPSSMRSCGSRSPAALAAENLFLRKQLALYQERHVKPRRATPATRVTLVWLARRLVHLEAEAASRLVQRARAWLQRARDGVAVSRTSELPERV